MRAADIRAGDTLELKRDNPYGFTGAARLVTVDRLTFTAGYATPWVKDAAGNAYRPSDFKKRA